MKIDKDNLSINMGGMFRCCFVSIQKQIKTTEIQHDTEFLCEHCKDIFVISQNRPDHIIRKVDRNDPPD